MELKQLQHFVAVAQERHFTRAAQRVHIVQSALSASVRALEDELGARLFLRNTRQVRLTSAGSALYDKALAVLHAAESAREAVAEVQGLRRGRLSVGSVQSLPPFLDLASLLSRFRALHPEVDIRLSQGTAGVLLEGLRDGGIDVAFLPLSDPPHGIATCVIACEPLVLACSTGHPLAGRTGLGVDALAGEPFVDFQPGAGTRRLIDKLFAAAGAERRTAFEVGDLGTVLDLVSRGLGVALLPETVARARGPALGLARLAPPEICWELVAAYAADDGAHSPSNPASGAFVRLLEACNDP